MIRQRCKHTEKTTINTATRGARRSVGVNDSLSLTSNTPMERETARTSRNNTMYRTTILYRSATPRLSYVRVVAARNRSYWQRRYLLSTQDFSTVETRCCCASGSRVRHKGVEINALLRYIWCRKMQQRTSSMRTILTHWQYWCPRIGHNPSPKHGRRS